MSEEENKSIEYVKFKTITGLEILQLNQDVKCLKTILNLIEKQQKEIEYQKELYEKLLNGYNERVKEIEELKVLEDDINNKNIAYIDEPEFEEKFISKDKIREKIKECEEMEKDFQFINNKSYARQRNKDFILMLNELLEED